MVSKVIKIFFSQNKFHKIGYYNNVGWLMSFDLEFCHDDMILKWNNLIDRNRLN